MCRVAHVPFRQCSDDRFTVTSRASARRGARQGLHPHAHQACRHGRPAQLRRRIAPRRRPRTRRETAVSVFYQIGVTQPLTILCHRHRLKNGLMDQFTRLIESQGRRPKVLATGSKYKTPRSPVRKILTLISVSVSLPFSPIFILFNGRLLRI